VRGKEDPNSPIHSGRNSGNRVGDTVWALRDVSVEIEEGEVLGIIGGNGAGKSTLLKIISRVTGPTRGQIKIRGRVACLLEVGTGFHPELTGRENVFLNGAILGMTKPEVKRKFDEIVDFSGVEQYIDTPVKRYSSGMTVRLAFAVAAHLEPEILVVDEVLAVGDAAFQKKCLKRMDDATKGGRTVLFVSHNMGAMSALATRTLLLTSGQTKMLAETESVIQHYLSSGAESGHVDLTAHPNRLSGMRSVLRSARLTDGNGALREAYYQGEDWFLDVCYDDLEGEVAAAGMNITTFAGQRVGGLNTWMCPPGVGELPKSGTIRFHIPRLPLCPGMYAVAVSVSGRFNTLVDKTEAVLNFTVDKADFYGTGYILQTSDGLVALRGMTSLVPSNL